MVTNNDINKLKEEADSLTEKLADSLAKTQEEGFKSGLESPEQNKERVKQEVKVKTNEFLRRCTSAYEVIIAELIGIGNKSPTGEAKQVLQELMQGQEKFNSLIQKPNWQKDISEPDITLQKILGYSNMLMERFYQVGIRCFKGAHYEDAISVFSLLSVLNPYEANAWLCLGISQQSCSHWQEAINSLNLAQTLEPSNPVPYLHEALCHLGLKDRQKALIAYENAIEKAGSNPAFHEVKERATIQKNQLVKAA